MLLPMRSGTSYLASIRSRSSADADPAFLRSAVVRIREVEPAARVPGRPLIPVGGDPARVLEHPRDVEQVPGHEGGGPVGEVVHRAARALVEIGGAGAGLADPAGVGLRR